MCTPTENRGVIFTDDNGKEFSFEQEGLNVWRSTFDNWLAVKASEKGAEVRDCTTALSCEESNGLVTVVLRGKDTYTEEAKYILDCEGISAGMETGYCAACAIANHFENLEMIYDDYKQITKSLKAYMERQWSFVAGMAGTIDRQLLTEINPPGKIRI